jgi:crossover junction endodeoxyribonuclease RuvC
MKWTLGVDPGVNGAIALIGDEGDLFNILDIPTKKTGLGNLIATDRLREWLTGRADYLFNDGDTIAVYLEQPLLLGRNSGQGNLVIGMNYGILWQALIDCTGTIPVVFPPAGWVRVLDLPYGKTARRDRACQLWPGRAGWFRRVKDDGRADAALIAHVGRLGQVNQ